MTKRIRFSLAVAIALSLSIPAVTGSASAAHRCGLEGVSHTVNTICDNYHSPKFLIQYLACIAKGQCPVS
jgi:hypothetical protein